MKNFYIWFFYYFLLSIPFGFVVVGSLGLEPKTFFVFWFVSWFIPLVSLLTLPLKKYVKNREIKFAIWWPYLLND